jgi:hypothetical protein
MVHSRVTLSLDRYTSIAKGNSSQKYIWKPPRGYSCEVHRSADTMNLEDNSDFVREE